MSKKNSGNGETVIAKKKAVPAKPHSLLNSIQSSATSHVTDRLQGYGLKPLKDNELKSIYALLAWVANQQHAAEETVRAITETRFQVNDVTGIQQKDYDEVIRFLVDLRIDEMKN